MKTYSPEVTDQIVAAHAALSASGRKPSLLQVSERSGYSYRTVRKYLQHAGVKAQQQGRPRTRFDRIESFTALLAVLEVARMRGVVFTREAVHGVRIISDVVKRADKRKAARERAGKNGKVAA